ncbi:hypothetical protein Pint_27896 [Pistacia integerrima]|uniref:Uncharacterized protein n=1 Tax=Pistacia integerrima TaxID=434235 RepID=A0ACC0YTE1_9ROSI|nr:hypothetical protein Pint_27896 [Pistacia integerrima]
MLNFIVPLRDACLICGHATSAAAAKLPLATTKQPQGAATPTAAAKSPRATAKKNPSGNKIAPGIAAPAAAKRYQHHQKAPTAATNHFIVEETIVICYC